jgi:hypothetical protein
MPKGKILMGEKTPAPIGKKPQPGRPSIYKGTDKSTNKAGKVTVKKTSTKPVVYGNSNYKPKPTPKKRLGDR